MRAARECLDTSWGRGGEGGAGLVDGELKARSVLGEWLPPVISICLIVRETEWECKWMRSLLCVMHD